MKNFRKPQLSLLLSFLILFTSCNNSIGDDLKNINSDKLTETVKKHLVLSKKISSIIVKEKNIDVNILLKLPKHYKNKKELIANLKKANLKNDERLADLFEELSVNMESFLRTIDNIENYTEQELQDLVTNEIKKQISSNSLYSQRGSCESALSAASGNCDENYAIAVGTAVVWGFISFGWGALVGYASATAIMIKCHNDAASAYNDCIAQQEQ